MSRELFLALVPAGAAMLLLLWSVRSAIGVVPPDDRSGKDKPPMLWRATWPLVRCLARWPGTALAQPRRARCVERLWRAGLGHALTPEQFAAGRVICALALTGLLAVTTVPLGTRPIGLLLAVAVLGYLLPASWLSDRITVKNRRVLRELPFFLDVLTLGLESGLNLTSALHQAIDKGPGGPLKVEFTKVMRDLRAGRTRADALRAMGERLAMPQVTSLVSALLTAEKQGASLGAVLRAQAEQRRSERFMRAEKLAMEAPVKMLLPLILFIFPCTFLILFFPVLSRVMEEGWLK